MTYDSVAVSYFYSESTFKVLRWGFKTSNTLRHMIVVDNLDFAILNILVDTRFGLVLLTFSEVWCALQVRMKFMLCNRDRTVPNTYISYRYNPTLSKYSAMNMLKWILSDKWFARPLIQANVSLFFGGLCLCWRHSAPRPYYIPSQPGAGCEEDGHRNEWRACIRIAKLIERNHCQIFPNSTFAWYFFITDSYTDTKHLRKIQGYRLSYGWTRCFVLNEQRLPDKTFALRNCLHWQTEEVLKDTAENTLRRTISSDLS